MQKFIRRLRREGVWRASIQGASKDHDSLIIRVLFDETKGFGWKVRQRINSKDYLTNMLYKYDILSNTFICLLKNYDDKVLCQQSYRKYIYYATIDARKGVVWIE